MVKIYTDGSCLGNPGPGGWCAILMDETHEKILKGGDRYTTNNKMEMLGVIEGLKALKRAPLEVDVYTDSQYVVNGFQKGWVANWKRNGWRTANRQPVKNQDLWIEMSRLVSKHTVRFHWVKGHSNDVNNNRCDEIATSESRRFARM